MIRRASTPQTEPFAARLAAIRAAIRDVQTPHGFGPRNSIIRRSRDESILMDMAADVHARLVEASAGQ